MQCIFIRSSNKVCRARAIYNSELCYFHNPDISQEEKSSAQRRGGQNRGVRIVEPMNEINISSPHDVAILLSDTINKVRIGALDARIANCLGVLSSHLLRAFEVGEMQQSLERIESHIQTKKP